MRAAAPQKNGRSNRPYFGEFWGRLLLFGEVDKGEDGTDQNTGLNRQLCNPRDCCPCYYHVYPSFLREGKKLPLLIWGERTACKGLSTALYLGAIVAN